MINTHQSFGQLFHWNSEILVIGSYLRKQHSRSAEASIQQCTLNWKLLKSTQEFISGISCVEIEQFKGWCKTSVYRFWAYRHRTVQIWYDTKKNFPKIRKAKHEKLWFNGIYFMSGIFQVIMRPLSLAVKCVSCQQPLF